MSSSNNKKSSVSKPFCKVCFDAKMPESQYTSHYVRRTTDPNSEVLCPILLATECRYCHKRGHTVSRCEVRAQNNRRREEGPPAPVVVAPIVSTKKSSNKFCVFEEDEEEEVIVKAVVENKVNEFPALGSKTASVAAPKLSYASAFSSSAAPEKWQTAKQREEEIRSKEVYRIEPEVDYRHCMMEEESSFVSDNPVLNRAYQYEQEDDDW